MSVITSNEIRKPIRVDKKGTILYMTADECVEYFKNMVYKEIRKTNAKMVFNNTLEDEDFEQELNIELWRAYKKYDINKGTCFSTLLYYRLKKGVYVVTKKMYAKKNDSNGAVLSIESENDEGMKIEDTAEDFASSNIESDMCASEMYQYLKAACSKTEKEKELFGIIVFQQQKLSEYAKKHGISRQAANRQAKVMRLKMQYLLKQKQFI